MPVGMMLTTTLFPGYHARSANVSGSAASPSKKVASTTISLSVIWEIYQRSASLPTMRSITAATDSDPITSNLSNLNCRFSITANLLERGFTHTLSVRCCGSGEMGAQIVHEGGRLSEMRDVPEVLAHPLIGEDGLQVALPPVGEDRDADRARGDAVLQLLDRGHHAAGRAAGQDGFARHQPPATGDALQIGDVDALVDQVSGPIAPEWRASSRMARAGRSLMLPPGFRASSLARSSNRAEGRNRWRRTRGVPPIVARTPSWIPVPALLSSRGPVNGSRACAVNILSSIIRPWIPPTPLVQGPGKSAPVSRVRPTAHL